jgi:hypothetical protein
MRNNLPILLAVMLMAIAAMPWLRSLQSQRWGFSTGATKVPPPEQAAIAAIPAGNGQNGPVAIPTAPASGQVGGVSGGNGGESEIASPPRNSAAGGKLQAAGNTSAGLPKPQELLDGAVRSVESRRFISARVKQQGEMFGQPITGEGRYFEVREGRIPSIRFELAVEVGTASTSLVQVCNGVTLWTYRKIASEERWSKIDVVRAITAMDQAAVNAPPTAASCSPGLGGLGRLVRGLNAEFEFTSVVAEQLRGLPVWRLTGEWRRAQLLKLLPDQKEAIEKGHLVDLTRLPHQLPDSVVLFLGQDDSFPYRIDYFRGVPRAEPWRPMGLEFFELNFNGPIDSGQFLFTPGSQEISDRTDEFIRRLKGE